ncbi:MAG: polysulfide reductase NrfD [Methylococcales bacterium]|nr:polysulfide reductase NrfD [Methylococcales bacterium]
MKKLHYQEIEGNSSKFFLLVGILGCIILFALGATYYMEHHGHHVTGMTNQVVWGMPHVFAIFLIICASGALNIASIGTVFGKSMYKPLARLSCLLALALLAGGLAVLVLDLGRPDRLIVAMTYYNFKSIFAWNIYLYTGFFAIVIVYIWTMMDRTVSKYYKIAGTTAFIWRLALTTGTGSIFGFLVARQAYDAAIMAPMFIVMSFSFGLAAFLLVLMFSYQWTERELGDKVVIRLKNLLGVFVAGVMYFVIAKHLTNLYATEHHAVEAFILSDGGMITKLFWIVQLGLGSILPLILLYSPKTANSRNAIISACSLILVGGIAQVYVILIGGQLFPLQLFPGMEVSSSFFDGVVNTYSPTPAEILLGLGGIALSLIIVTFAVKFLKFLPVSLADDVVDPHHS